MLRSFLTTLALGLVLVSAAWPQAGVSAVRGVARDPTQAVIPNASVTLTNTATNLARTTKTNDVGIYVFPSVIPGPYRITMEAAGFQKFEATLTVMVQQDATVDGVLPLGQTATQLEVQDVTQMVRVDSATLGHVLERQRIEQLPINGRSYQNLLATVPGIDSTGIPQAYGMRTNTSVTLFDGTPVNESYEGWDFARPPGLDSIAEFQVEVNNSSAKFTRPTTIILSSKSGTNAFHGSAFETNRNSGYGVARRRQDNFQKPPFLNRNEFGASAGGPIYVPKVYNGKNRTFFYFAWEASRNVSASTQQWTVPTEAMRNGDFRGLVDDSGRRYDLYDPFTTNPTTFERLPLTYHNVPNMIDPARISPTAKYLFSITPLPTLPQVNPLIDNNWVGPYSGFTNGSNTSIRIDHRISDNDLLYGRYSFNTYTRLTNYGGQSMLNNVAGTENYDRPNHTVGVTWVRTISPSMTNELLVSASRENEFRGMGDRKTNYVRNVLGLPNVFNEVDWPGFDGFDLGNYTFGTDGLFTLITNFVSVQDNATKVVRKHELQFGFHSRFELLNNSRAAYPNYFSYGTLGTSLYDPDSTPDDPLPLDYTGHGMANMYLGIMDYTNNFLRPAFDLRRREYAAYLQDNWKVTPRLTLNLGLRYELRPPIYDSAGTLISFSLDKHAYVIGESLDQYLQQKISLPSIVNAIQGYGGKIITYKEAGLPQHLIHTNWKELGPRLGVAYRALDGARAFVLRSGFRVSYYPQKMQDWAENQYSSPPGSASFSYSVTDTALSPDGLPNYGLRTVPKYIAGVNSTNDVININDTRTLTRGFSARVLPSNYTDGRVMDWNFTLEKEVMSNTVVRAAYVGNYSTDQQHYVGYNDSTPSYVWYASKREPLPTGEFAGVATRPYDQTVYGTINMFTPLGWSHHNSFQFEFERRYHKGLGFQVFYRTAKTLLTCQDTDGTQSGETVHSLNYYMPGAVPTDLTARDRFLNYRRDNNTPRHQIQWNFIADLPVGRGKKLGGNMNRALDKVVGGWQVAGLGSRRTTWWTLPPTSYWITDKNIQVYGYKYPIQDCRSGICYPGYLWWNGYIPANLINSHDSKGNPNGIMGVPADYKPAAKPLITWGQTALPPNAPANTNLRSYWDTNTTWLVLNNGRVQRTTFNDNLNPWRYQYVPGPIQWFQDASLFKFVNITEKVTLRLNVDFFNVFNNPNNPTSVSANGVLATRNSGSAARTTQLTVRLIW